jgi:hypothetical protein
VSSEFQQMCILSSESRISIPKTCEHLDEILITFWNNDCFPFRYWKFSSTLASQGTFQSSGDKRSTEIIKYLKSLQDAEILCMNSVWLYQHSKKIQDGATFNFNQFKSFHQEILQERYGRQLEDRWLFVPSQ